MSDIDLIAKDIGEDDFGEVLLLLVAVEVAVLEFLTDMRHLSIDSLLLELSDPTCSDVRDVLRSSASAGRWVSGTHLGKTPHGVSHFAGFAAKDRRLRDPERTAA